MWCIKNNILNKQTNQVAPVTTGVVHHIIFRHQKESEYIFVFIITIVLYLIIFLWNVLFQKLKKKMWLGLIFCYVMQCMTYIFKSLDKKCLEALREW